MDIIIIANFCAALDKPTNSRFTYIADLLYMDNDVEIVGSTFCHDSKSKRECDYARFPYKVTLIEEPGYRKNISISRFLSHRIWGNHVYEYIKGRKKPDVIYCAVPSLTAAGKVGEYCKNNNIKFVIDIQDLWPEAFQMVFHLPVVSNVIFMPFKNLANKAYRNADEIIGVSQTYVDRALLANNKCKIGYSVFLGTKLETFDKNAVANTVNKPSDEIWIGYCGTLGNSYDLTCVIDALALINSKGENAPKFIVMGDGHRRTEFEEYAKKKRVETVFTGNLPYPQMCGMVKACDMVVNPIMKGAAQSIINKHADYAASGHPVINTQECKEYRDLVDEYHMGFNCRNNDPEDMAKRILELINDKELLNEMGLGARKCAEEKFDRKYTYRQIVQILKDD